MLMLRMQCACQTSEFVGLGPAALGSGLSQVGMGLSRQQFHQGFDRDPGVRRGQDERGGPFGFTAEISP